MEIFKGKVICQGMTLGPIHVFQKEDFTVNRMQIDNPENEIKRMHEAKEKAISEIQDLYDKALASVGEESAAIFEVHSMMIQDGDYLDAIENIINVESVNAEYAVITVRDQFAKMFRNMDSDYMKEREVDVIDVSNRLVGCLRGDNPNKNDLVVPSIVVADDLTPSDTIRLEKSKILAFVTKKGASNSHTAILARTMNIPAITGMTFDINSLVSGTEAIVDATKGVVVMEPDEAYKNKAIVEIKREKEKRDTLLKYKGLDNVTLSGKRINLYANIGCIEDLDYALDNDAGGIGLFRSEFLYIGRSSLPEEEEQYDTYKQAVETLQGKKLIIRTLDIGADKKADYLDIGHEENPALGFRAIRLCLKRPSIFKTQLRALYRAAAHGPVSIMFPMIISVEEVMKIREICHETIEGLEKDGLSYGEVEIGIMIETPAAVMISDELAKLVDFFSIGTNDLTQYTLAIDRQNENLEDFYNPHHKAILKMIKIVVDNAHKEGKWVGICGELAADTALTETFIEMGIDELSVSAGAVLAVRQAIRNAK